MAVTDADRYEMVKEYIAAQKELLKGAESVRRQGQWLALDTLEAFIRGLESTSHHLAPTAPGRGGRDR